MQLALWPKVAVMSPSETKLRRRTHPAGTVTQAEALRVDRNTPLTPTRTW
jgi:hypothetical protein